MKSEEQARLEEECLHYLWNCHEDEAGFAARLAKDPELAKLLEDMRSRSDLMERAATAPAPELHLEPPVTLTPGLGAPGDKPAFKPRFLGKGLLVAASLIIALFGLVPSAMWAVGHYRVASLEEDSLRLVVSAPRGVPDGSPAQIHVDTWNLAGGSIDAQVDWEAFDSDGRSLASGSQASGGAFDLQVPANLPGLRRLEVVARHEGLERRAEVALAPDTEAPLIHLSTDKPVYRPGETVRARLVVLDRLSLELAEGSTHVRIVDAKGAVVHQSYPQLEQGTAAIQWTVPENARGGEHRLEIRDSRDEFAAESLGLLVRRFQPPTLKKNLRLDRETYVPGESGRVSLSVERITGGIPAGAEVAGTLLVDGESVWTETRLLDSRGVALFEFTVPQVVERGEGRFTCRIVDGGVVETAIEPFVIPTGKLEVAFYPEGGELIAGLPNRIYAEITDTLGRPVSARGDVLDARGRKVARFESEHQGRARFEFTPEESLDYTLQLEDSSRHDLPASVHEGATIRAAEDVSTAGTPLAFEVATTGEGPFVAGLFCRGVLVAQDTFRGQGKHELELSPAEKLAGVLRLTIFDRDLKPIAERLVARSSDREIRVSVRNESDRLLPGEHQKLEIETRDENGDPVACVLGLAVTDRAVRDMTGEARIGLADQTWLFADVEELEDVAEFLAPDAESRRNVDLVLGTRGWRRFAWVESEKLIEAEGDRARRLLIREGRPELPTVQDEAGDAPELVATARRELRKQERSMESLFAWGVLLLVGTVIWRAVRILPGLRTRPAWGHAAGFAACVLTCYLPFLLTAEVQKLARLAPADAAVARFAGAEDEWLLAEGAAVQDVAGILVEQELEDRMAWNKDDRPGARAPLGAPADARGRQFDEIAAGFGLAVPVGEAAELEPEEVDLLGGLGYLGGFDEDFDGRGRASFRQVRRVYAHRNARTEGAPRTDFTETIYWNALLVTPANGRVTVEFDLSDRVTTWEANVDAHGAGRVGQARSEFRAVPPFHLEAKLPVETTVGDELLIPVAFRSEASSASEGLLVCQVSENLVAEGELQRVVPLHQGEGRSLIALRPESAGQTASISVGAQADDWRDSLVHSLRVVPRGFPQTISRSGVARAESEFALGMPETWIDGSLEVELVFYPSPLSELVQGMEGLLQQPGGCFEQASRSNYPNVLALTYMRAVGDNIASVQVRSNDLLEHGYGLLTGYECSDLGYEWFGGNPGHEALTAYGLLQFHDMAQVYDVDAGMMQRTRGWLLGRRDGQGGYEANSRALDSFGRAPKHTTDAYCSYSLLATGTPPADLEREIAQLALRAMETEDAYELALCAAALEYAGRKDVADSARERLKAMQREDGSLVGEDTITRSGSSDLAVETTSLAILAWLQDPADEANVRRALQFVVSQRSGSGTFGTTQATILALKALTGYAQSSPRQVTSGEIAVFVNDYPVDTIQLDANQVEPIRLGDFAEHLSSGPNRVRFLTSGGNEIPWSLGVRYTSEQPANSPEAKVTIQTSLAAQRVDEGETVSLRVEVRNLTREGQPMTMAIVGLPAGLEAPTEVLNDLRDAGRFDFWELQGRELVLYWRDLAPGAAHEVNLDLLARIPGTTTGPASRVRLYYTPQDERWSEPLRIEIAPE